MKSFLRMAGIVLLPAPVLFGQTQPEQKCREVKVATVLEPGEKLVTMGESHWACKKIAPATTAPAAAVPAPVAPARVVPVDNKPQYTAPEPAIVERSILSGPVPLREKGRLSDSDVNEAIARGFAKRHQTGLVLTDVQVAFVSGLLSDRGVGAATGMQIVVFTPTQWIEKQAMNAKGDMRPFTIADVDESMRAPVLHVSALPSRADYISGPGMLFAQGVRRIVLSDTARQTTIQPSVLENGSLTNSSALRDVSYNTATALFPMSTVAELRERDAKGEFFIVVVGDKTNKFFKIKQRDFRLLGW